MAVAAEADDGQFEHLLVDTYPTQGMKTLPEALKNKLGYA